MFADSEASLNMALNADVSGPSSMLVVVTIACGPSVLGFPSKAEPERNGVFLVKGPLRSLVSKEAWHSVALKADLLH